MQSYLQRNLSRVARIRHCMSASANVLAHFIPTMALHLVPSKIETGGMDRPKQSAGSRGTIEPSPEDVVMGRGKKFLDHPGNKVYADLINASSDRYFATAAPLEKRDIIAEIVDRILERGGRFLKRDATGHGWIPVTKDKAFTKTAHAIQYRQRKTAPRCTAKPFFQEEFRSSGDQATMPLSSFVTPVEYKNEQLAAAPVTTAFPSLTISVPPRSLIPSVETSFYEPNPDMSIHHAESDETVLLLEMNAWLESLLELEDDPDCFSVNIDCQQPQTKVESGGGVDSWCVLEEPQLCHRVNGDIVVEPLDKPVACQSLTRSPPIPTVSPHHPRKVRVTPPPAFKALGSWDSTTRRTSLGIVRVTSFGSLVSVDEEFDGNVADW